MPTVAPLRGLRYDPTHVGALSQVIAPPYDVIDAALQKALYERHPANVIRLELNREEPGDDEHRNKYTRAARFLREWRDQGVVSLAIGDITDPWLRQAVQNEATRRWGPRNGGQHHGR